MLLSCLLCCISYVDDSQYDGAGPFFMIMGGEGTHHTDAHMYKHTSTRATSYMHVLTPVLHAHVQGPVGGIGRGYVAHLAEQ